MHYFDNSLIFCLLTLLEISLLQSDHRVMRSLSRRICTDLQPHTVVVVCHHMAAIYCHDYQKKKTIWKHLRDNVYHIPHLVLR